MNSAPDDGCDQKLKGLLVTEPAFLRVLRVLCGKDFPILPPRTGVCCTHQLRRYHANSL